MTSSDHVIERIVVDFKRKIASDFSRPIPEAEPEATNEPEVDFSVADVCASDGDRRRLLNSSASGFESAENPASVRLT